MGEPAEFWRRGAVNKGQDHPSEAAPVGAARVRAGGRPPMRGHAPCLLLPLFGDLLFGRGR